jgi:DNA polymerase-1
MSEIEIAKWLLDPDRNRLLPDDLAFLEARLKELGLEKVYTEIELPLAPILEEMEKIGIKVDLEFLEKLSQTLVKKLDNTAKQIYKKTGTSFNLNSPQQLSEVLFEKLKIDSRGVPKRKTGAFSTDAETLLKIKDRHPIVLLILEYRELFKIHSTYLEPLKELAVQDEKRRIHTQFLQTGTATGRLASQNPNLQNIPVIGEWGKQIRRAFIAEKNYKLASFDYSQIELRVLAAVSRDSKMIEAFQNDLDIHKITASNVYNVPVEKVTPEMRQAAKTLNFGVIYGMGPEAFARQTGYSREEAENFINEYFMDFAEIKRWQEKIIERARQIGYAENLNGRKRWLPAIVSENRRIAAEAERAAINMPIQSLAADIIKLAMIKTAELFKNKKLWQKEVRLLLSIHDELLFEIRDDMLKETIPLIQKTMETAYKLDVPLKVDAACGKNWAEI